MVWNTKSNGGGSPDAELSGIRRRALLLVCGNHEFVGKQGNPRNEDEQRRSVRTISRARDIPCNQSVTAENPSLHAVRNRYIFLWMNVMDFKAADYAASIFLLAGVTLVF